MTEQAIAELIDRVQQLELRAQRAEAAAAAAQAAAQTAPQVVGGLGFASASGPLTSQVVDTNSVLNSERLKSYVQFRTELIEVRRAQMSSSLGGATPMEIGDLGKGGKGACQICGKKGHRADRCWHRSSVKGKEGKAGKGKETKGKPGPQKGPSPYPPPPAANGTRPTTSKTKC